MLRLLGDTLVFHRRTSSLSGTVSKLGEPINHTSLATIGTHERRLTGGEVRSSRREGRGNKEKRKGGALCRREIRELDPSLPITISSQGNPSSVPSRKEPADSSRSHGPSGLSK